MFTKHVISVKDKRGMDVRPPFTVSLLAGIHDFVCRCNAQGYICIVDSIGFYDSVEDALADFFGKESKDEA
ncbi:hypothetical protein [Microvirus mar56]|uniref:Uncharacterized protein n=1 Tax=Microvirus mar56 TaxID=2851192 RepID=A0A8F5MJ66_9VIRU|nr:hypothetical protein [Microvirus mar56]